MCDDKSNAMRINADAVKIIERELKDGLKM
jgi:hypothetical protein